MPFCGAFNVDSLNMSHDFPLTLIPCHPEFSVRVESRTCTLDPASILIKLPSTVTEVGQGAFKGCTNLREVELNEGLEKIGYGAFYRCTSLPSIKLPLTYINGNIVGGGYTS